MLQGLGDTALLAEQAGIEPGQTLGVLAPAHQALGQQPGGERDRDPEHSDEPREPGG